MFRYPRSLACLWAAVLGGAVASSVYGLNIHSFPDAGIRISGGVAVGSGLNDWS